MRFVCFLEFKNDNVWLPTWYRIGFASLIKEALHKGDPSHRLFELYYANQKKNIPKPFTFAIKLNIEKIDKGTPNKLKLKHKNISLYVSSSNYEFIIALYNGLLEIKQYPIYDNKVDFVRCQLLPERRFDKPYAVFNIFSPVVVRRVGDDKKGVGYAHVNDDDYTQMLAHSIKSQCKFLSADYNLDINNISINTQAAFPVKIPHYNKNNTQKPEIIVATDGCLKIEAPQEVLKLIYDIGLGARRSQGFGMLEVVE